MMQGAIRAEIVKNRRMTLMDTTVIDRSQFQKDNNLHITFIALKNIKCVVNNAWSSFSISFV